MGKQQCAWEPLYYLTHDGIDGDSEFYQSRLGEPCRVLDLGCGIGRLTEDFLSWGHVVTAVDQSEYAISYLRARAQDVFRDRLNCITGDFTKLDFEGPFDRVVLSFNGLLCLPNPVKLTVLKTVKKCLTNNGVFLLDLYDGAPFVAQPNVEDEWVYDPQFIKAIQWAGTSFDVYESGLFRSSTGELEMHYHYFRDGQEELDEELAYRIVHFPLNEIELRRLTGQAGLSIRQIIRHETAAGQHLFLVLC